MNHKKIYQTIISLLVLIISFTKTEFSFAQADQSIAVLLIHGLAGKHTTWEEVITDQINKGNIFVGNFFKDRARSEFRLDQIHILPPFMDRNKRILFFTLDFSHNQNLSFHEQGNEVKQVVEKIRQSFNTRGIMLVGHSMGGLAARRYILDYGTDGIIGLITITTPHLGSFLAYSRDLLANSLPGSGRTMADLSLYKGLGIDLNSKAVNILKPDSPDMIEMYNQIFPESLPTALILSDWNPKGRFQNLMGLALETIRFMGKQLSHLNRRQSPIDFISPQIQRTLNDGVVTIPSQDITKAITNGYQICPGYFYTDKFHMETNKDVDVFNNALLYILEMNEKGLVNDCNKYSVGFILDSSGSMAESDPKDIRKNSIIQLLDYLYQSDDIFLVDFDGDAHWINQNNFRSWNKEGMIHAIQTIDSRGGTDIGAGLSEMRLAMQNHMIPSAKSAVMLFSDGKGNFSDETRWFSARGIPVYTVSYKDYADGNLLSKIADETGGVYFKANNEMDVILAFHQFISECKNNSWMCSYQSEIRQSQSKTFDFHVDPLIRVLNLFCNWQGSRIELKLTDPLGRVYSSQAPSYHETWHTGTNYQNVMVQNPQPGKWTAEFNGIEIPPQGETFLFNASADLANDYQLSNGIFANNALTFSLNEKAVIVDGTKVIPILKLRTPGHRKIDISGNFQNGIINVYPTDGPGDYTLAADFLIETNTGALTQRHFERSVRIGANEFSTIARVTSVTGNYLKAPLGKNVGNRPGIKCYVFDASDQDGKEKAIGIVTYVTSIECNIEIQQYVGTNSFSTIGDIVKLDLFQWQNDNMP